MSPNLTCSSKQCWPNGSKNPPYPLSEYGDVRISPDASRDIPSPDPLFAGKYKVFYCNLDKLFYAHKLICNEKEELVDIGELSDVGEIF
jgi:hypothetical protein